MKRRFGETLPVRLPNSTDSRLRRIAEATGLNKSDIMRIALAHGLPLIEAGQLAVEETEPQKGSR